MRIHEVITFEGAELQLLKDVQDVLILPKPPADWTLPREGDANPLASAIEKRRRLIARLGEGAPQFLKSEVRDILTLATCSVAYVAENITDYKAHLAGEPVTIETSPAEYVKADLKVTPAVRTVKPTVSADLNSLQLSPEHSREIVAGLLQSLERHRENVTLVSRLLNVAYDSLHDVPDDEDEDGDEFGERGIHDFVVRR